MTHRPIRLAILPALLLPILAACSPATPEEKRASDIVRCKEQFGVMANNPQEADALCGCMVDTLTELGMTMGDMQGSRAQQVQSVSVLCAKQEGIAPAG